MGIHQYYDVTNALVDTLYNILEEFNYEKVLLNGFPHVEPFGIQSVD